MDHLRLLVDLTSARAGGGLQNAMSFVMSLAEDRDTAPGCLVLVAQESPLPTVCCDLGVAYLAVPHRRRRALERSLLPHLLPGTPCFTLFAGGLPLVGGTHLLHIVGCALSNLFHPEVPFWSYVPWPRRARHHLVDVVRWRSLTQADYWIFETAELAHRAVSLAGFPRERVEVVRMAVSPAVSPSRVDAAKCAQLELTLPLPPRLLFLSSTNPNKRLHCVPRVLAAWPAELGAPPSCVLTIPPESEYARGIAKEATRLGVSDRVSFIGRVPPDDVANVIACSDAVCLFSRLESFSNNCVEAWAMGKPLVVTDAAWAHDACGPAAVYLDPESPADAASRLAHLLRSSRAQRCTVASGYRQLRSYPSAAEKYSMYLAAIMRAKSAGPCPPSVRGRIRRPRRMASRPPECT